MSTPLPTTNAATRPVRPSGPWLAWLDALVQRWPFVALFGVILLSNLAGSIFNIGYNRVLIVERLMSPEQKTVFEYVAFPVYNLIVYPVAIGVVVWLLRPLTRCRRWFRRGSNVPLGVLELARQRLVNLPFYQVCINFAGWLPGAIMFPLIVCGLGGNHEARDIWLQFIVSFFVSALLTTAQTFFLLEWFLKHYFYADFFAGGRPAASHGVIRIPFWVRLSLLWSALAVPLLALWLVARNMATGDGDIGELESLAVQVLLIGGLSGLFVFWLVGSDLSKWVAAHGVATEQVELGNFEVRVDEQRPDEWGQLTDRFNDMVAALMRARQERETFGEIMSPEVRDDILQYYPDIGGDVEEITVLFADIRGFTRRTTGKNPTVVFELLNRFLTLAFIAIESKHGWIDKVMGDGVMAIFGLRGKANHADQAVAAAQDLINQLQELNTELIAQGEAPLDIGIGIHTGRALVGCVGFKRALPDGRVQRRRAFTAIGETVNLAQRLEQMTKAHEGPILISEQTRTKLRATLQMRCHGTVPVPGYDGSLLVYQVQAR